MVLVSAAELLRLFRAFVVFFFSLIASHLNPPTDYFLITSTAYQKAMPMRHRMETLWTELEEEE
jgi:hypothetical protein